MIEGRRSEVKIPHFPLTSEKLWQMKRKNEHAEKFPFTSNQFH